MNPIPKILQSIQSWWASREEERKLREEEIRRDREYWARYESLYPGGSSNSFEWQQLRLQIVRRDHYRCVKCGRQGRFPKRKPGTPFVPTGPYVGLHVHHIQPLNRGGTNHPSNLQTLCIYCHEEVHGRRLKGAR